MNNWVEEFMNSNEDLHIDNFKGTKNLIMICPLSSNTNYWLRDSKQMFELSESGKRLHIVDYKDDINGRIVKTFNMKSIINFGYTK